MNKIRILQLGNEDWSEQLNIPEHVEWIYKEIPDGEDEYPYDVTFLGRVPRSNELDALKKNIKSYTLFVLDTLKNRPNIANLMESKKGEYFEFLKLQDFLDNRSLNYFGHSYGEKYEFTDLTVNRQFAGSVKWNGNNNVTLNGDFGQNFSQIVSWRITLPISPEQAIDFWLEYEKDEGVEIELEITKFLGGSVSTVQQVWTFDEVALRDEVTIDNRMEVGYFFASLKAKGNGRLSIISLHDRHSRRGVGSFLPGGDRFVTSNKEEFFCYFDPGDRKPPLNVYFSGYKTQEGFEGYNLMRRLGCPFLLVTDVRLEGGSFYMGAEEYENMVIAAIRKYVRELNFGPDDLIFSGLSMGTFGALKYGCEFMPHAIVLGKPLANIGDVATNEKYLHPEKFATALDVLYKITGEVSKEASARLNDTFWERFDKADFGNTKFIVSYMIEDDYDPNAYGNMITHLHSIGVQVYGKGLHGRHNDDTQGIVQWFESQYNDLLYKDFDRRNNKQL